MRQFVLAGSGTYLTTAYAEGAIGFTYLNNGAVAIDTDGTKITREGNLVLARSNNNGGNIVIPIFKNNFSYTKGVYSAATTFEAEVIIEAPTSIGDYSIIVAKKGVKFNERNKWTAMVHVRDLTMTADTLAKKIADAINNNVGSGVTAEAATGTITITADTSGVDYEILGADELFGVEVTVNASGIPAYGDAKYVQDLAEKAAADAGFEYTYRDAYTYLYPNYPLNPLKANDSTDTGFTIFTLRFAEPRDVKTRDEVVNQIVQVAFPTGATAISTFETVCKALAG